MKKAALKVRTFLPLAQVLLAGFCCTAARAAPVNLVFANNVQAINGTAPVTGEGIITNSVVVFQEVAAGIDLRVTVSTIGSNHAYNGLVPNRDPALLAPAGDLGLYYSGTASGTGGVSVNFAFFQSDNSVNGSALLTTPVVRDFSYTMTDIDGEGTQSERLRAFYQDGLRSYQVSATAPLTVTNNGTGTYTFAGASTDRAETDRRSAVVLNYLSTSSFTLQFEATTTGAFPNPVFVGIDGNSSVHLVLTNGGLGFGPAVNTSAPEPTGLALLGILVAGLANWRSKSVRNWWRRSKVGHYVRNWRARIQASQIGV